MDRAHCEFEEFFEVRLTSEDAQAAEMTLAPGQRTGGPDNYHEESDQWLFVASGTGVATVDGEDHRLDAGDVVRIEAGERHAIENDGDEPLATLNVYVPPLY
ncbi:MAG: cupin domain-containing protein [Haloarculaceae archaeon]